MFGDFCIYRFSFILSLFLLFRSFKSDQTLSLKEGKSKSSGSEAFFNIQARVISVVSFINYSCSFLHASGQNACFNYLNDRSKTDFALDPFSNAFTEVIPVIIAG